MGGAGMKEYLPVNVIDRIEGTEYAVERCTCCGATHRHGGVPEQLAVGETTRRHARCKQPGPTVYLLKRTAETEVVSDGD